MNILVLGGGGREHALSWKIAQSKLANTIFIAPGNAGTAKVGTNVQLNPEDFEAVGQFCIDKSIDLVVVGPEAPLVAGIVDYFKSTDDLKNVLILGPDKAAAQLEGSKDFAKKFMQERSIPTARYQTFTTGQEKEAKKFLSTLPSPFVLKADGLAAGKGVVILDSQKEAEAEIDAMLGGKFGDASRKLVIEEFLEGREFSVFALTDGKNYKLLPMAKDYKRIGEGDTGPNTGGMGAVSPVSFVDDSLFDKVENRIVKPTIAGLNQFDYCGFVFFGLIEVRGEPFVIEYNVRMGDPETEVVLPRIESDLLPDLLAAAKGTLSPDALTITPDFCSTVMAVSEGYPGNYAKGKVISGLENLDSSSLPFHAGTQLANGKVLTNGGRVIALSAMGKNQKEALEGSYKAAKTICFEGIAYRKDIGFDL